MAENPFKNMGKAPQRVLWSQLLGKVDYHVEMVQPSKALLQEYTHAVNDSCAYIDIVCYVLKDQKLIAQSIIKGDYIMLGVPIRTLTNALWGLPRIFRSQFKEEDNLEVVFIKASKASMIFTAVSIKEPDDSMIQEAIAIYGATNRNERKRPIVRGAEEL